MEKIDLGDFYCSNEACQDYGKKGRGNIVLKERYGENRTALLRCKTLESVSVKTEAHYSLDYIRQKR
jgi:hypothetical protein